MRRALSLLTKDNTNNYDSESTLQVELSDKCLSLLLVNMYTRAHNLSLAVTLCLPLVSFTHLLFQVKSYARVYGQTQEGDKGCVSISYNEYVTGSHKKSRLGIAAHFYRLIVLCAFIFINILTPIALAKSVSLYYPKIKARSTSQEVIGLLYVATAIFALLCNVLYTAYSIRHYTVRNKPTITSCIIPNNHECTIPSGTDVYRDEVVTLVAVIVIIPFAVFIELLISIYTIKNYYNSIDRRNLRYSHFWKQLLLLQIIDVFVLWNIFIMLQMFTKIAIPICVLLLIHPPGRFRRRQKTRQPEPPRCVVEGPQYHDSVRRKSDGPGHDN